MQTQLVSDVQAVAPPKRKEIDIKDVARKALDDGDGDVQKGVALMAERMRKNRALFNKLMDPLLESACFSEIGKICRSDRRAIWVAPNYSQSGNGQRVANLASGNLLMFPLPGGKPLGEATREEVEAAAKFYGDQAEDMGHKARWLRAVAQRVPAEKLVAHALDTEQLRELQEETKA